MKAQRRLGLALSWPRITSAFLIDVAVLVPRRPAGHHRVPAEVAQSARLQSSPGYAVFRPRNQDNRDHQYDPRHQVLRRCNRLGHR
jgi:hypothetical protein